MNGLSHQLLMRGPRVAFRLLGLEDFIADRVVAMDAAKGADAKPSQRGNDEEVCRVTEEGHELPANPEPRLDPRRTVVTEREARFEPREHT